jgi:hypothetical protein
MFTVEPARIEIPEVASTRKFKKSPAFKFKYTNRGIGAGETTL